MDTDIDSAFYVFNKDGKYVLFGLCTRTNLYILDVGMSHPNLSLLHSIAEIEEEIHLAVDVRRAEGVRELQIVLASIAKQWRPC